MQIGLCISAGATAVPGIGMLLPRLASGPAMTGGGREATALSADATDTWTHDGAQAVVGTRQYRLLVGGLQAVAPQASATVTVPPGTAGSAYAMQLRAQVTAVPGIWSSWYTIAAGTIVGAPRLSAATAAAAGAATYSGSVSTDTGAGTLYWAVTQSPTPPDAATLKAARSQPVTASGAQAVSGNGLAASTSYCLHFLQQDADGYDSAILSTAAFATSAPAPSDPAAFGAGDWSVANLGTGGDARITVTALPADGGDPLKALEVRIGAGPWTALGAPATGSFDLIDRFTDGVATDVRLRAVNLVGAGPDGVAKSVITSAAPTVPAAFGAGDWALSDAGTGGDAVVDVLALPSNGGSALTGLFVRIGGSAPVALGGAATGAYPLNDLFTDGAATAVTLLAANAVGQGTESAPKSVTTTSPQGWTITDSGSGSFTLASAPAAVAAPGITDNGLGTFTVA